ncbi:cytochrome c biogenesis CcdA family protein [Luedemannella helvata]|uniref:Cytochrome c biogenesis protein CcdA n=1 Tax=Luedemannella helvata TaxID=349315 RepID=A0ABP4XAF3_9ACTN
MGETFAELATGGPILVAVGVAALAGLVSFLSPCVLPLVPGYLSYMTGLAGADLRDRLDRPDAGVRGRVLLGTAGFIAGFTVIFTLTTVVVAGVGRTLLVHQRPVEIVVGALIIVLGAAFLGWVPGLQREWRVHKLPAAGLASAPLLGAVFALSWVPCIGPTLGAVLGLATVSGSTPRAVTLAVAYSLGLGLPFVIFGLGFRRLIGVHKAIRRHSQWVTRVGGALLIVVGLALVTGVWGGFLNWLRATIGPGSVGI